MTPLHASKANPPAEHRIRTTGETGNECVFHFHAPRAAQEIRLALSGTCDAVAGDAGELAATCVPAVTASCVLRRQSTVRFVELLREHAVLHEVNQDGVGTALTFIMRGDSTDGIRAKIDQALRQTDMTPVPVSVQPLMLPFAREFGLRPIETETLALALKMGYYEVPRRCTMEGLGQVLGITKSAVYHRLSTVESKALRALAEMEKRRRASESDGDSTYPTRG